MPHFLRRGQANFNSRFHAALHASDVAPRPSVAALQARSLAAAQAQDAERKLRSTPLASAAGYDRSAIMRIALFEARDARARGSHTPWRKLISSALCSAWLRAKLQRSTLLA